KIGEVPAERPKPDAELIRVLSKAVEDLGLEWSALDKWYLPVTRQQSSRQRLAPFLPAVNDELTKTWCAPYSARVNPSTAAALTTIDGADEKGHSKLPPLEEAVATHLCPPSALRLKAHAAHPSKPCMTSLAVLQVFQAKLLCSVDKSGQQHQEVFNELRTAKICLCTTKAMAQAITKTMASLVVLERHLWLNLTEDAKNFL
ncbi:hypothetical protein M9458_047158, partial [Cirrhinus mrigala]